MVEKARDEISAWDNECGCAIPGDLAESIGKSVLDAILPQVTTVAELEALPLGAKVLDQHGWIWEKYTARSRGRGELPAWRSTQGAYNMPNSHLDRQGPLTVVWTPEVTS